MFNSPERGLIISLCLGLSSLITVTDLENNFELKIPFVNQVEIEKSRTTLTNTAKMIFARRLVLFKVDSYVDINEIFKRGAAIKIELGYNGNFKTEFTGYVTEVGAKTPLEIKCQDEMWLLKQNSFSKSFKTVKVAEIVKYL